MTTININNLSKEQLEDLEKQIAEAKIKLTTSYGRKRAKIGEAYYIISSNNTIISNTEDGDNIEIIEEKQEKKPKFKIGDFIIGEKRGGMRKNYTMIHSIFNIDGEFAYNFEKYREYDIRIPTKEELETYFK